MPPTKPTMTPGRKAGPLAHIVSSSWLALPVALLALLPGRAGGQEVPRPSFARQKEKTSQPTVSNFKIGEVLLRVDARMSTEFVDNVDASPDGKADVIINPEIGLSAIWAVTKLNTLRFRAALGYSYYVNSPNLNRQTTTISPDSALSFDVFAGDVRINFHDQFSLQQEAISQGTLSGVAQLERFTNTAGVSVLWDTNDLVWTFGYDHFNFITLGGANSSSGSLASSISTLDHSTDQISFSIAAKLNTVLIGGMEGVASYSDYPEQPGSNFSSVGLGPYFEWQVTKYTHAFLSGGYKGFFSGDNAPGSVAVNTTAAQPADGNPSGYYANFSLIHRLNRYYSDRLDFSHNDEVEGLSGHLQTNSMRYSGNWRVNQSMVIGAGLFFEDVKVVSGSALGGTVASDYSRFGISLSTGHRISEHVDASLSYQFIKKDAERATESFSQNRVTISVGYRF